jgi:hypothetical protein
MFETYLPWQLFKAEQDRLNIKTRESYEEADKRYCKLALQMAIAKHY